MLYEYDFPDKENGDRGGDLIMTCRDDDGVHYPLLFVDMKLGKESGATFSYRLNSPRVTCCLKGYEFGENGRREEIREVLDTVTASSVEAMKVIDMIEPDINASLTAFVLSNLSPHIPRDPSNRMALVRKL